ncbi:MAG: NAD+ synthase [Phycisphaerales bacterium]
MRLALAQINPTVGDLAGNAALITRFARDAADAGADLAVFPELALAGYPPRDLLLQRAFVRAALRHAHELAAAVPRSLTLVVGVPLPLDRSDAAHITNSLLAFRAGELLARYDKRLLPTYDVFDEDRYFTAGASPVILDIAGVRVGLSICEDLWRGHDVGFADRYLACPDPVEELVRPPDGRPGAQLIVNPSASPFVLGKGKRHRDLLRAHAQRQRVHVAAVNQVGGNDELIFDGHACAYDPAGTLLAAGPGFTEALTLVDIPAPAPRADVPAIADPLLVDDERHLYDALVLGIRDYCRKTGFKSAVLGLSGGIDSAVTAVLAAAALGPANVLGIAMPSRYSSEGSRDDAGLLAHALGMPFQTIPIEGPFAAYESTLRPLFAGRAPDVAEENLQSRIRGTILMAASNKLGHLLLTTGNKSELAVGYCTLYGDMNGGLAVLSDITKILVYRLARWMNAHWRALGIPGLAGPPIPDASISKPPSAELRPNQTDQDSLPPYEVLDEIIERYVERREPTGHILAETRFDEAVVRRTIRMIDLAEYKRKQAPIGLKVTGVAFGSGRRMPIAQGWRPDRI